MKRMSEAVAALGFGPLPNSRRRELTNRGIFDLFLVAVLALFVFLTAIRTKDLREERAKLAACQGQMQ